MRTNRGMKEKLSGNSWNRPQLNRALLGNLGGQWDYVWGTSRSVKINIQKTTLRIVSMGYFLTMMSWSPQFLVSEPIPLSEVA